MDINTRDTVKAVIVGGGKEPMIIFEDEICEMNPEMREQIFAVIGESTREDKLLEELSNLEQQLKMQPENMKEQLHQQKLRESQVWKKSNQTHPVFKRK